MSTKERISRVKVQILNDEYIIRGKEEVRHIEEVAQYVDLQMKQIALKDPTLSPKNIAVLAAVNIADDYLKLQRDYDELISLLDDKQKKGKVNRQA
ncbi:MAG: cell division protein ZapA [Peptococcia bacterium]